MTSACERTVSPPAERARYISRKVAPGARACGSEVVRAGLRALPERDAAVERWLLEEVTPTHGAMTSDPGSALSAGTVRSEVQSQAARSAKRDR